MINVNPGIRQWEPFKVNFARTKSYKKSTIPTCQRLLNEHFLLEPVGVSGHGTGLPGAGAGGGAGDEAGVGAGAVEGSRE